MAESGRQAGLSPEGTLAEVRAFPGSTGSVALVLRRGDIVHVRGPNGCGKTSLLRALAGLDAPLRPAAVRLGGDDPRGVDGPTLARRVRAVWASPRASLVGLTVAGEARLRGVGLTPELAALADRDVATLSAGESRKLAIAMAAANPAPLLLLDEPFGAMDVEGDAQVVALVRAAAQDGAVVLTDHTGHAAALATRTLDLGPTTEAPWPAPPRVDGPPVLRALAFTGPPGPGAPPLILPALVLAAGLHAVTGRNGAGKSTLLRRLAGLTEPTGVVVADRAVRPGVDARLLQPDAGELLLAATVADELGPDGDLHGLVPAALLRRHPLSLSAGEAQRVALAKALRPAPLHLLDEPEAHLDANGRGLLAAAVARRITDGACIVVATHDAGLLAAARTRTEVGA